MSDKRANLSDAQRALLEQRLRGIAERTEPSRTIARRDSKTFAPLSFAQQRLWFLDQLQPGNSSYNVARHLHITGAVDLSALKSALNEVVSRHESLRTVIQMHDSQPAQIVQPPQTVPLPLVDLSGLSPAERDAEAKRLAQGHAAVSLNLSTGPLLAAQLITLSSDRHVLFLVVHHIVTDAWSTALLVRELDQLYEAFRNGKPSPLSELPIQYADFAIWQRERLSGETLEKHLSFWKKQLANVPAMLELPLDRPRPAVQSFRGDFESFNIPDNVNAALKGIARQEGATLFMVLVAAFQTLLWRHTRQDEIVIGAPIANRTRKETESLIGFFVNTLVIRTPIKATMTFRDLLRQVRDTTLATYNHQDLPFEKLVEELQPERSLSHNPLFQVTLSLQNVPQASDLKNFTVDPIGFDSGSTRLDLEAYFWDLPTGHKAEFVYSTDLFDRETIRRLVQRFLIMLEGITGNPDSRVSELPLLSPDEIHELLPVQATTARNQARTVHELFERQVASTPNHTALSFENESLSYAELNARANRLANYLIKRGAKPDQLVGLCVDRSIDLVVSILGILKAGAAYVPLDPTYPEERLLLIAKDSRFDLVVTQDSVAESFKAAGIEPVSLGACAHEIENESDNNPGSEIGDESTAYVIYTSGSTGKPKGVAVTHRNVARLLEVTRADFNFGPNDVWTLFHSYAFDFSVWEIWGALLYGGRLVIVPFLTSRAPEDFYDLLANEGVTILNQTPSAFRQLIQAEANKNEKRKLGLREVIFGGEALELRSLKPWVERHGDTQPRLVNMYGITETTVHVTYRPLTGAEIENETRSLIGAPLDDLQVYVLDRQQQLTPAGVAGEMYVGGGGVARGYLHRPELTAERFVPNPFSKEPGARLYRTGDLARYVRTDPVQHSAVAIELEYLGRVDRQVKVRGFRIELGEIENVLAEHESVHECLVIPGGTDQQLLAYVVSTEGETFSAETLRTFLKSRLPLYMVPAVFLPLQAWPLTPNGKIDERALPAPDPARHDLDGVFIAARNETETALVDLWSDVLRVKKIGVNDNFFDLGGHSLLATQVMARIREKFNVNMPLRYFFERPTVAGLAEFLQDTDRQEHRTMPEIRRLPRG